MTNRRPTRRKLLEGTAGLAVAGLAGCIGSPGASTEPESESTATEGGESSDDGHAGHGDESHGHDTVSEPKASREVVVNTARSEGSTEYHFDPHVTWVEPGGTVTWRLESGVHTATAYHPGNGQPQLVPDGTDAWDSGTMSENGETFTHTFENEGVYHYLCTPHEQFGMIATVIVGRPHLEDQTALHSMPGDKPEEVHGKLEQLNTMVREIMGEGHHDDGTTEDGHHDDETDHHDDGTTEDDHHDDETDHHGDGTTEDDHHDDETDHHDDGTTEDGHHDDETDHHGDGTTEDDHHE